MAKRIRICLDAGHYGKYNRSPVVKAYYESNMTWELHLLLKKHLESYGFEVITTRSDKAKDLSLSKRGKTAKGCDLFLSLHSNATGGNNGNESVDRVDVYAPLSGKGHDIAFKLANRIVEVMGTKQGGNVKTRKGSTGGEYYGVIRGAVAVGVPGLLVEHSFHTCTRSALWLLDDTNLDKLARAEAQVLAEHYGMTAKVKPEAPTKTESAQAFPYLVKVTAGTLNVRRGPGTNYGARTQIKRGGVYTIVDEKLNGTTRWGLLKSYSRDRDGWIALNYTKKV